MKRTMLFALTLLVAAAVPAAEPYKRPRWSDLDRDGQNTRTEVLISQCSIEKLSADGRTVVQAVCLDVYAGTEIATDTPSASLQIDHIYAASEAWKRRAWTKEEFKAFFNDQDNLLVTRSRTNNRKGYRGPDLWCPATPGARLLTAARFRRIATRYRLPIRPTEELGLRAWERGGCAPGARVLGGDV